LEEVDIFYFVNKVRDFGKLTLAYLLETKGEYFRGTSLRFQTSYPYHDFQGA